MSGQSCEMDFEAIPAPTSSASCASARNHAAAAGAGMPGRRQEGHEVAGWRATAQQRRRPITHDAGRGLFLGSGCAADAAWRCRRVVVVPASAARRGRLKTLGRAIAAHRARSRRHRAKECLRQQHQRNGLTGGRHREGPAGPARGPRFELAFGPGAPAPTVRDLGRSASRNARRCASAWSVRRRAPCRRAPEQRAGPAARPRACAPRCAMSRLTASSRPWPSAPASASHARPAERLESTSTARPWRPRPSGTSACSWP